MAQTALWVGDSFTAGEGAWVPASATYPYLVSARLGWECAVDAQNGTGFTNDGWLAAPDYAPLIQRLADDVRRYAADVVIVDGGRNDVEAGTDTLHRAIGEYLSAVRAGYPAARLVLVLPSLVDRHQPPEYGRVSGILRELAPAHRAEVVDPAGAGAFADPDRNRLLVCEDGFHPSAAGQAHYADVLTELLRPI
jgi:lysophospholipase L1-like esterase